MKLWMAATSAAGMVLAGSAVPSAAHADTTHARTVASAPSAAAKRGVSGPWRIDGGAKWPGRETGSVHVKNAHARICFNFWGSGTRKGFYIWFWRLGVHGLEKVIWTARYWGPKNKTCSPWIAHNSGDVFAVMSVRSHAYGDVWIHWY